MQNPWYIMPTLLMIYQNTTCGHIYTSWMSIKCLIYTLKERKKWLCFRPLLCTLFRLNWAKQTPGIMRRNQWRNNIYTENQWKSHMKTSMKISYHKHVLNIYTEKNRLTEYWLCPPAKVMQAVQLRLLLATSQRIMLWKASCPAWKDAPGSTAPCFVAVYVSYGSSCVTIPFPVLSIIYRSVWLLLLITT